MPKEKKQSTVEIAAALAEPVAQQMGLSLWDVRFEKEGSEWFLRFFIDRDGGVNINMCEDFSRTVEKLIDEADPIEQGYYLEVSSPGIERVLNRAWHYEKYIGKKIRIRFIRALNQKREYVGELKSFDSDRGVIISEGSEIEFMLKDIASAKAHYDYNSGENIHE